MASASAITLLIFPKDLGTPDTSPRLFAKRRDRLSRFALVLIQRKRAAIRRKRGYADFRRDDSGLLFQLHVADDVWTNRPCAVRQRRATEAGMEFVGDRRAADLRAAFEHERLVSCLGQVESGDQPVVAAADNDDVIAGSSGMA